VVRRGFGDVVSYWTSPAVLGLASLPTWVINYQTDH